MSIFVCCSLFFILFFILLSYYHLSSTFLLFSDLFSIHSIFFFHFFCIYVPLFSIIIFSVLSLPLNFSFLIPFLSLHFLLNLSFSCVLYFILTLPTNIFLPSDSSTHFISFYIYTFSPFVIPIFLPFSSSFFPSPFSLWPLFPLSHSVFSLHTSSPNSPLLSRICSYSLTSLFYPPAIVPPILFLSFFSCLLL